jgi:hypothetical protein
VELGAVLWVGISVGGPAAAAWAWAKVRRRIGPGLDFLLPLAPWAHAILPGYLALLTGSVLGRDFGLYGAGPGRIASGLIACGAALAAGALARRWIQTPVISPLAALLEEPRWALYRSAGLLWLPGPVAGVVLGIALAIVETGWRAKWWIREARARPEAWFPVLRAALSAVVFVATRSFWLSTATQVGCLAIASKRKSVRGGEGAS